MCIRDRDSHVRFDVDGHALDEAIRHVSGFGIRSLVSQPPTLEELFLRHYGDELEANGVDPRPGPDSSDRDAGDAGEDHGPAGAER